MERTVIIESGVDIDEHRNEKHNKRSKLVFSLQQHTEGDLGNTAIDNMTLRAVESNHGSVHYTNHKEIQSHINLKSCKGDAFSFFHQSNVIFP